MPFKALLRWTGHDRKEPDHVIIAGVSENDARAYAQSKHYSEGSGPGQFHIEPFLKDDNPKIPDDFSEAPAATPPPVVNPADTVTTPATIDSLAGASGKKK